MTTFWLNPIAAGLAGPVINLVNVFSSVSAVEWLE
jgi:hypothetical protein